MKFNSIKIISATSVAVLLLGVGFITLPRPPQLSEQVTGDRALIAAVRDQLPSGTHDHLSVAVIDNEKVRTARFGAEPRDTYEIGSVTKTFTGSLLAIAIKRGEVTADTKIGNLLELGSGPVAEITLQELATQSSGLPPTPPQFRIWIHSMMAQARAADPYVSDPDEMIRLARETAVGEKTYRYSNLGMALLGEGLVEAAGADDYSALVAERITGPLQMTDTFAGSVDDRPTGFTSTGRPADNWPMSGYAGAGALRSTLTDMIIYLSAQADGSAPGVRATKPIAAADDARIGYAWQTIDGVTMHNGMTGGFCSFVGFDRRSGRAVVILSNTAVWMDELGMSLLGRKI